MIVKSHVGGGQFHTFKSHSYVHDRITHENPLHCAPIWHPWQDKLSYKVERVQRAAARYVLNDYNFTSSVTDMLKILNWQTLENRRIQNSLILLYKTKYHLVAIDHFYLTETRNLNFFVPYSRTNYHMNSFFPPEQSDIGIVSLTA